MYDIKPASELEWIQVGNHRADAVSAFDPFDAYEGSDLDRYKFELGGW